MSPRKLQKIALLWRRLSFARELLFALAAGCAAAAVLVPWTSRLFLGSGLVFGGVLATRLGRVRPWRFDAGQLALHLNRTHPELEESSALYLRPPETLTLLERLQRRRTDAFLARTATGTFGTPGAGFLRRAAFLATLAFLLLAGALTWKFLVHNQRRVSPRSRTALEEARPQLNGSRAPENPVPRLTGAELKIAPPAYTGKPVRLSTELNGEVEEGSQVTWQVALDHPVRGLRLVFGQGNSASLALTPNAQGRYEGQQVPRDSGLYHLAASLPDGTAWSPAEIYSLKIVKDLPPVVKILRPEEPRTELGAGSSSSVPVDVSASDDYAVASARIVATVAKGSGEAVKFREQNISLEADKPKDGAAERTRALHFTRNLDLKALGMEPGDELYFYVEAVDNRQPTPNRARSETRFVVLKGPETKAASSGQGVAGVNLVPEYFRSERQIIIDAEKLIADRAAISGEEFRGRSNELGIDQQLLRLRYGQFLGEELEQGQGAGDQDEVNLDPLQHGVPRDMIHQHDTAPEGGETSPRAEPTPARHEHPEDAGDPANRGVPPTAEQVVAPFVDQHDSQDKATLFDHEQKNTMRDALAAMWDAEGFLRTNRPQEALAPANKALTILKEIQQSARAYVQHVGFEPAPLKVDSRRLKGDVTGVRERVSGQTALPPDEPALAAVRRALGGIPWHSRLSGLTGEQAESLRLAEPALTAAATRQPDVYLGPLQTLLHLSKQGSGANETEAADLEKALLHLLPAATAHPIRAQNLAPGLSAPYFQALRKLGETP